MSPGFNISKSFFFFLTPLLCSHPQHKLWPSSWQISLTGSWLKIANSFSFFLSFLFFSQCSWCQHVMICFAPVTDYFVFFYFNPLLASQLGAESSGAGVLSSLYLCHLQMVRVNYTMFLQPCWGSLSSLWSTGFLWLLHMCRTSGPWVNTWVDPIQRWLGCSGPHSLRLREV